MADLNEGIVEQYAEHLLQKAASVVRTWTVLGALGGFALGAAAGLLSHSVIADSVVYFAVILGGIAGAFAGRGFGETRAVGFRFQAQMALRQLQIESRLVAPPARAAAQPPVTAQPPVAAPVAPAPVAPAPVAPAPVAPPPPVAPAPVYAAPPPVEAPAVAPAPLAAPPVAAPAPVAPPLIAPAPAPAPAPTPAPLVAAPEPPAPPAPAVAVAPPRLVAEPVMPPVTPPLSSAG